MLLSSSSQNVLTEEQWLFEEGRIVFPVFSTAQQTVMSQGISLQQWEDI